VPNLTRGIVAAALLLAASSAFAGDDVVMLPVATAINTPEAQQKLSNTVKFYFGAQPVTGISQDFGEFVANPKTNAFAKTVNAACQWVFLSALLSLQERAESLGANAVIHIVSYFRKRICSTRLKNRLPV
jgi:hypothetical protein